MPLIKQNFIHNSIFGNRHKHNLSKRQIIKNLKRTYYALTSENIIFFICDKKLLRIVVAAQSVYVTKFKIAIATVAATKIRPIVFITIPAIANFRLEEFMLMIPNTNPRVDIGSPTIMGNNEIFNRLKTPSTNDVMARAK